MIKKITFNPTVIGMVKSGVKTITRRVIRKEKGIYYFTAGRTGKKEGYIEITRVVKERLQDIGLWGNDELIKEGFQDLSEMPIMRSFIWTWNSLNKPGYRWTDNPKIYRMEFRYLKDEENWTVKDQIDNNKLLEERRKKLKDLAMQITRMLPISLIDAINLVAQVHSGIDVMEMVKKYAEGKK